jgi:hypothetical protein
MVRLILALYQTSIKLFAELDKSSRTFYCLGDFNIHLEQKFRPEIVSFEQMLTRNCLTEVICQPTRNNAQLDLDFYLRILQTS